MSDGASSSDLAGALEALLGHRFARPELIAEAITHRSLRHVGGGSSNYERLEFLGDRVLGLVVAKLLIERFPDEPEGDLARRHAQLVRGETLAAVAIDFGLDRFLQLAKGERSAGEAGNPTILADACEALIGALFLDGGLAPAEAFVEPRWLPLIEATPAPPKDAKTGLQEWAQGRGLPLPSYREVARSGPDHSPLFTIEVTVEGRTPECAEGRSKRTAEQEAAKRLLTRLERKDA